MADATVTAIAVNTWVKVATATTICNFAKPKQGFDYYHTERDTGGSAPSAITPGIVPAEAVPLFRVDKNEDIVITSASADVYVCCFVSDSNIGTGSGSVRVGA